MGEQEPQATLMDLKGVLETSDTSEVNELISCGGKLIATATHLVDGHQYTVYSVGISKPNRPLPSWAVKALSWTKAQSDK